MNIVLKSFDGAPIDKIVLEHALRGRDIGTCVFIGNDAANMPDLPMKEKIWLDARHLREDPLDDVDWNETAPLDAACIEGMRHCEAVYEEMIDRYTDKMQPYRLSGDIPHAERRKRYFDHLRYWNDLLDAKKIDFVLLFHVPHQGYDYVLYGLCKFKRIPVLFLEHIWLGDKIFVFVSEDWEQPALELHRRLDALRAATEHPDDPVCLSPTFEAYYQHYSKGRPTPLYMPKHNEMTESSFLRKWGRKAMGLLRRNPRRFLISVFSPRFWSKKIRQHATMRFYDRHCATSPDLSRSYVYFPLHLQPEATTLPLAGAYADQERIVHLLAAHLPPGTALYIKEHPAQGERCRSEDFYRSLLSIPSVTFVPRETDTYVLLDRAQAVATATGTVGLEALLRGKPVLMFGHFYYQYGPGVHPIRTSADCKKAVETIGADMTSARGSRPIVPLHAEREARLFLKAFEESATLFMDLTASPDSISENDNARNVGARIAETMDRLL
jgi:hypothetical protein